MRKKIVVSVLLGLITASCGVVLLWWLYQPASGQLNSELTAETQHRFEKNKSEGDYNSRYTQPQNDAGETFLTACFSVTTPLPFSSVKKFEEEDGSCRIVASLSKPRGQLAIHSSLMPALATIDEHSGVIMRTQSADYTELFPSTSFSQVRAFQSQTELTIFIYENPTMLTVSFSDLGQVSPEIITAAEQAVASLELLPLE